MVREEREPFYAAFLQFMGEFRGRRITNSVPSELVDSLITEVQLHFVREFIVNKNYISEHDIDQFSKELYKGVTHPNEYHSYAPFGRIPYRMDKTPMNGLIRNLAKIIANDEPTDIETILFVEGTLARFSSIAYAATAMAFNDRWTFRKLRQKLIYRREHALQVKLQSL